MRCRSGSIFAKNCIKHFAFPLLLIEAASSPSHAATARSLTYGCAVVLSAILSQGCNSEKPPLVPQPSHEEQQPRLSTSYYDVTPIEGSVRGKLRGVRQIFRDSKGNWHGWEVDIPIDRKQTTLAAANVVRFSPDAIALSRTAIATGGHMSGLSALPDGKYQAVSLSPKLRANGSLELSVTRHSLSVVNETAEANNSSTKTLFFPDAATDGVRRLEFAEARRIRSLLTEPYEESWLLPSSSSYPQPGRQGQSATALLTYGVEAGILNLDTGVILPVAPLTPQTPPWNVVPSYEGVGGTPFYVIQGKAVNSLEAFHPRAVGAPTVSDGAHFVVVEPGNDSIQIVGSYQSRLKRTDKDRLRIEASATNGGVIYLAGTLTTANQGESASQLWLGKIIDKGLVEKVVPLKTNVFVNTLQVYGSENSLFVGGVGEYHQASSGSVSETSGFVVESDLNFVARDTHILRGPRSTRVFALSADFATRTLWVGGATNSPSTHDSDLKSESFVTKIPIRKESPR